MESQNSDSFMSTGIDKIRFARFPAASPLTHEERDTVQLWLRQAEWIVDALMGTTYKGDLPAAIETAVDFANEAGRSDAGQIQDGVSNLRLAIEVPTGFECDTGEVHVNTFFADHTVTMMAHKAGFKVFRAHHGCTTKWGGWAGGCLSCLDAVERFVGSIRRSIYILDHTNSLYFMCNSNTFIEN